ncbi:FkbM family methyltransferase [Pectobacterium punjabense]|uniref:FkbM family methyltransferase n=1 Tax=Pectobacterium punjabense TaxID=2108399 RepID=UPI002B250B04|nr:FkbM family methyltransferase [Pectobacterium punjabense]
MLPKIIETSPINLYKDIETIKKNGYPVVLVGISQYSSVVYDFLRSSNVQVDIVSVNKKYLDKETSFLGKDVIPLEEVVTYKGLYNYVIGFQPHNDDYAKLITANAAIVFFYDILNLSQTNIFYNFICQNEKKLQWFFDRLADDVSRESLISFINQRISCKTDYCNSVFYENIYFLDSLIEFSEKEVFVDCGAYIGDSILSFLSNYRAKGFVNPKKVYCLEPDNDNFAQLSSTVNNFYFCQTVKAGAWNINTRISFLQGVGELSKIDLESKSDAIDVVTIDSLLDGAEATFIKMDIEGAELAALQGAENTIRNYKPKLAISLYHKPEDLIEIPYFLHELNSDYKFYLRCHQRYFSMDMVLYAIV